MTWIQQIFGQSVPASHVATITLGSYLVGCFTTGYYLVRFRLGLDIRETGSGSVGTRNAGRILGIQGFLITLAGDFGKGALAVWITRHFENDDRLAGLALLAVVMGHIWPAQLSFRGGKGVATTLGALAVYDIRLAAVFGLLFAGTFFVLMRTTLSGLIAFTLLPLAAMFMEPGPFTASLMSIIAALILLTHRRNLYEEFTLLAARRHAGHKPDDSLE